MTLQTIDQYSKIIFYTDKISVRLSNLKSIAF